MLRFETLSESGEFDTALFNINSLDDEIRVDHRCEALLRIYYHFQIDECGTSPEQAGSNARGADYLLREFIIGDLRENLFKIAPLRIRQFAGNWYITRALEPNCQELQTILQGVAGFYTFLEKSGHYPSKLAAEIRKLCLDLDYYQQRIDTFWALESDGYSNWRADCPLEG